VTIALMVLLAATGVSCVAASSGTPLRDLPSPSAVPDPHPAAGIG
jgi:hypothetical protein